MWDYEMTAARAQEKRDDIDTKSKTFAERHDAWRQRVTERLSEGCHSAGLSAISYANGFTLWHYRTSDSSDEVLSPGYFDTVAKMLRVGDFMFVNAHVDGPNRSHGVLVVLGNDAARVSVNCVTGFGSVYGDAE